MSKTLTALVEQRRHFSRKALLSAVGIIAALAAYPILAAGPPPFDIGVVSTTTQGSQHGLSD